MRETGVSDLDAATMEGLITIVERFALRSVTVLMQALDKQQALQCLTVNSPQVQELAAETMKDFASFRSKEGLLSRQLVIANARVLPPSQWWWMYRGQFRHLQQVARGVFSQPVSACACERNWSIYGAIKGPARSRLQHDRADKRVYCHESLHYQNKLQNPFYRQPVVSWDSDSDSDQSVTEEGDMCAGLLM